MLVLRTILVPDGVQHVLDDGACGIRHEGSLLVVGPASALSTVTGCGKVAFDLWWFGIFGLPSVREAKAGASKRNAMLEANRGRGGRGGAILIFSTESMLLGAEVR